MGLLSFAVDAAARRTPRAAALDDDEGADLVAQLGGEVAATLSLALERVNALASTGRIDRTSLRCLREEIERARRIGMIGQQLSRFASGQVRLHREPLDLAALLRDALQQRLREAEARGIELREQLHPAMVMGDTTLTFSLLQALLDWSFEHTCSRIDVGIDHKAWPAHARLNCSFGFRPADEVSSAPAPLEPPTLDTMSWRLLQHTASTLGLALNRDEERGRTHLTIEFPAPISEPIEGVSAIEIDSAGGQSTQARPLAGAHLLVVAARREVRHLVRESVRSMGLMMDFVTSIDEAREFCRGGMPHVLVHEAALGGESFERLRRELQSDEPALAFIQITDDGKSFEVRQIGDRQFASVGREAILHSLPAALMFELSRSGI